MEKMGWARTSVWPVERMSRKQSIATGSKWPKACDRGQLQYLTPDRRADIFIEHASDSMAKATP
jgi:hypothetical protein